MWTRLSWLLPFGVITGAVYGVLTTAANLDDGGVLVLAAGFGALFGLLVSGAAVGVARSAADDDPGGE